jgi:hypothetical protein
MLCLYCAAPLVPANESLAHVVPESLGGRLAGRAICCATCNNGFSPLESICALRLAGPSGVIGACKGDGTPISGVVELDGSMFQAESGGMYEEAPPPKDRGRVWPLPARADRQVTLVAAMLRQRRLPPRAIVDGRFALQDALATDEPPPRLANPGAGVPIAMEWGDLDTSRVMVKSACELLAYSSPALARLPCLASALRFARYGLGRFHVAIDTSTQGSELPHIDAPYVHSLDVWTRREALYYRFGLFSELRFVGALTSRWSGPPLRLSYSFDCREPRNCRHDVRDGDGDAVVEKSQRLRDRELAKASERLSQTMRESVRLPDAYRAEALSREDLYAGVCEIFKRRPWRTTS